MRQANFAIDAPRRAGLLRFLPCACAMLAFLPATTVHSASPEQLLKEAVQQYQAALDSSDRDRRLDRFRRAELLFARLAARPDDGGASVAPAIRNAHLYVNLGNAALGAERLGPAIIAYRRAVEIDPNHTRAVQNLNHARRLLPAWVPRAEGGGILDTFFAWTGQLSRDEQQWAAAMFFMAAAVLWAASIRWRRQMLRNLALIPALLWLFFLGTLILQSRDGRAHAAVVVAGEVVARAADSPHAPVRFSQPLPGGTEVDIIERREDWSHIRLADGRDAWVNNSAVELVSGFSPWDAR